MNRPQAATDNPPGRGFTLIELLIVVAIIGILAAIAIPNFLEAQTRGKLARVRSDMRTIATALEAYCVDNHAFPPTRTFFDPVPTRRFRPLTSPVAYLSGIPRDPFQRELQDYDRTIRSVDPSEPVDLYLYNRGTEDFGFGHSGAKSIEMEWSLTSGGPDLEYRFPYYAFSRNFVESGTYLNYIYDPTNGTISSGEVFRRGGVIPYPIPGLRE